MWTPEEVATLRALRSVGVSYRKIAERLGKTRNGCIGKGNRIGLPASNIIKRVAVNPQAINAARTRKRSEGHVYPAPKISDEPLPDINAGEVARVTFDQLLECHCRWPVDVDGKVCYCGSAKVPGMSWCEDHAKRVFSQAELKPLVTPKPRPAMTHPISLHTAIRLLTS
jgi:hypothetical protein